MFKSILLLMFMPLIGFTSMAYYNSPLNSIDVVWNTKLKYGMVFPSKELMYVYSKKENISKLVHDLTITLIGEAGKQPLHGKVSVLHVIFNRYSYNINRGKYVPMLKVIHKRNQFSCWLKKYNCRSLSKSLNVSNSSVYAENRAIVIDTFLNRYKKFVRNSKHYANVKLVYKLYGKSAKEFNCSGYRNNVILFKIGDHTFCR